MMDDAFLTIAKDVEDEIFKEMGSKFINYAFHVRNEDEIKQKLDELRERWPDATHHCYAYVLGIDKKNYRANDDGEPSGSAGLPIYNQILSSDLTNILIVSVRYFGGTKLGVPGLVKAYKYAAQIVIENAKIVTKYLTKSLILESSCRSYFSIHFFRKCEKSICTRKFRCLAFIARNTSS